MDRDELLKRIKAPLAEAFGERLKGVVLYGSEARGEARADSDIDVLVLLAGPFDFSDELDSCIDALYPLVLELGRPIHALPVDLPTYQAQEFPVYRFAHEEGVRA